MLGLRGVVRSVTGVAEKVTDAAGKITDKTMEGTFEPVVMSHINLSVPVHDACRLCVTCLLSYMLMLCVRGWLLLQYPRRSAHRWYMVRPMSYRALWMQSLRLEE